MLPSLQMKFPTLLELVQKFARASCYSWRTWDIHCAHIIPTGVWDRQGQGAVPVLHNDLLFIVHTLHRQVCETGWDRAHYQRYTMTCYSLCTHCTDRCVGQAGTGCCTSAAQWLVIHCAHIALTGVWDRVHYPCYMTLSYTQRCARIEDILTTYPWFVLDRKW